MDCEQAMNAISARIDHEISTEETARLEAHLTECAACRAAVEAFQTQDAAMRRAYVPCETSAAGVTERVIAQLRAAPATIPIARSSMKKLFSRRTLGWTLAAAAVVAGVAFGIQAFKSKPGVNPDSGPFAHGVPVDTGTPVGEMDYMTARRLPDAPAAEPLLIGQEMKTGANERRRVTLPDGSIAYLNQNTSVWLSSDRHLKVTSGEVFLEVAPRGLTRKEGDPTFVVETAKREVVALGTKFAVKVEPQGTGVVVTQGKVKVTGLKDLVHAGQMLKADSREASSAPRASYVLDWTRDLMAAAESPLVPRSKHCGGALVALDPYGQEARLSLRKYKVDVHIEDGFARTTIDQTYFNHNAWRMEGTFYFPLPADASLSRLAMYVANGAESELMEGGMAEKNYARDVYEQIVTRAQDPALLEWLDGSTFKMRVFPLEGRQEKRIVMSYTQKLDSLYGHASYRFPGGHNLPVVGNWSFECRVKNGAQMPWTSANHQLKAETTGDDLVLKTSASNIKPDRDMGLQLIDPTSGSDTSVRFSSAEHEGAKYLMLRYRPNLNTAKQVQRRDWVFVFETSGDRDPLVARAQVEVIRTLLNNAGHDDTFQMVRAGTRVTAYAKEAKLCTADNVKAGLEFLEKSHLIGALDMGQAIDAATRMTKGMQHPTIVHVGTGIAAMGERKENELVKRLPENVPFVGVGVGKRWSRSFMKNAADKTGGAFTQINPDESISWRAFELFSTLNTPRLMNVKVIDGTEQVKFLSYTTNVAQGEEICAIARIEPGQAAPTSVAVAGTFEGQTWTREVPVQDVTANAGYLPRTWAKLEIDRLLAEDQEKHKNKIIDLSKAMYVMTPFTSLLVLENEAMYKQYNVDRGRKDHWAMYDCPSKIKTVYEPDPSQGIDWRAPKGVVATTQKASSAEVLRSILVRIPGHFFRGNPNQYGYYGQWAMTAADLQGNAFALAESDSPDAMLDPTSRLTGGGMSMPKPTTGMHGMRPPVPGFAPMQRQPMPAIPGAMPPPGFGPAQDARFRNREFEQLRRRMVRDEQFDVGEGRRWRERENGMFDRQMGAMPMMEELAKQMKESNRAGDAKGEGKAAGKYRMTADEIIDRLMSGYTLGSMMYQRPAFGGDERVFFDLVGYAPGMNSTRADILATVEAEAQAEPNLAPGSIDERAAKLIEKARTAGWQTVIVPESGAQPAYTVSFNGSGSFAYERVLPEGLHERVFSDGKTLLHLYPELGIGARRSFSRFHQADFARLVPWTLPAVEDLARGNELTSPAENVVRITPRLKDGEKKPTTQTVIELVFAKGRLAERRAIELPAGKVVSRETYGAEGAVKLFDADGKVVTESNLAVETAEEAPQTPATNKLVVLPLPYRTQAHVYQQFDLNNKQWNQWSTEATMAAFAGWWTQNPWQAMHVYQQNMKDEKRIGFATLLVAGNIHVLQNQNGWKNLVAEHADTPLGKYLAVLGDHNKRSQRSAVGATGGDKNGFIQRLSAFRDMYLHWQQNAKGLNQPEREKGLAFVRANKSSAYGWAILCLMRERIGDEKQAAKDLADAFLLFEKSSGLNYSARYEYATLMLADGQTDKAREVFLDLYTKSVDEGMLPPIDANFRRAIIADSKDSSAWGKLIQATADKFMAAKQRATVIALAAQCRQLEDTLLADDLLTQALTNVPQDEKLATTLMAIEHLLATNQQKRAEGLLEPLLKDEKLNQNPSLWYLAASVSMRQRVTIRSVLYLDKAMELEYRNLPAIINVQQVRNDYSRLLGAYQQVVQAMAFVEVPMPKEFVGKVIRAADRWRSLDTDPTMACQTAARILKQLGETELAWEYMTTPSALRPNESAPHLQLAQTLMGEGEFDLADKAYAAAFEAEQTNPQILMQRAQALQQAGKTTEARKVYRQIADGSWQPRFQWMQQQARQQLGVR
ncbi:MAG: FecR domain-containing protein [Gemmataceae bacterium]|nr:FecR domain-containing protein [Gemmataceae bacterium]